MKKAFFILIICLILSAYTGDKNIFVDKQKIPLEQYNRYVYILEKYYPHKIPQIIIDQGDFASFDPEKKTVYLNLQNTNPKELPPLGLHEAAHVINYEISDGFSLEEQPRFIDEGMGTIIYTEVADGDIIPYRDIIINCKVKNRKQGGKAKFSDLMRWKTYAGDYMNVEGFYQTANYEAYDEAASFVYFLIDAYDRKFLYKIFKDLAKTKDLNITFKNILHKSTDDIEKEWHNYIDKSECKPKI